MACPERLVPLLPLVRYLQCYKHSSHPARAEFPTTCSTCHNTENWDDAIYTEHDALYFPIFSGAHSNKWASCSECHEVPSDYGVFTCISCHEHDQTRMDEKHKEEDGYVYESAECFDCHPNGKSD